MPSCGSAVNIRALPLKHTLVRGITGSIALRGFGHVLRLALGVLLARALGAAAFGTYSYATSVAAIVATFAVLGMDHIAIRFLGQYVQGGQWALVRGFVARSQQIVFGSGIAVALVTGAVLMLVQGSSKSATDILAMVLIVAVLPLIVSGQVRQSLCRGLDRPVMAQVPENIVLPAAIGTFFVAGLYLAPSREPVVVVAGAYAAAWCLAWIAGLVILRRSLPPDIDRYPQESALGTWLRMSPGLISSSAAYLVFSRIDVLVLDALFSAREVGLYVVATRAAELVQFLYEATFLAGAATFSALFAANDRERLNRFVLLVCRVVFWGTLPVLALFLAFAVQILGIFGPEYVVMAGNFRILAVAYYVSSIGGFVIPMMYVVGRQREVAWVLWLSAALNLILCLMLAPVIGPSAVVWSFAISLVVMKCALIVRIYFAEGVVCFPLPGILGLGRRRA